MNFIRGKFLMFALTSLLFCGACKWINEDEFFPGVWDKNVVWRCMRTENLPVDTISQQLVGVWVQDYRGYSVDSIGPFIDTLEFQSPSNVRVVYEYGHQEQRAYGVTTQSNVDGANYRIEPATAIATLPEEIYICEDKLFFPKAFLYPKLENAEYGFLRVE